jgi:hypothetical protein
MGVGSDWLRWPVILICAINLKTEDRHFRTAKIFILDNDPVIPFLLGLTDRALTSFENCEEILKSALIGG